MEYLLMAMEHPVEVSAREDEERAPAYWAAWRGYVDALAASGAPRQAGGLEPAYVATTLRLRDGQRHLQDGPYADTKEQLGGYFVVEVPDLDAALAMAAQCPCAGTGSVEVRPVLPPPA